MFDIQIWNVKKQWLRPKVNSDEIKLLIVAEMKKGTFGSPPDSKAMTKFTKDETARRKADGRMSPNGKIEYRFNSVGKIVFESVSDSPVPSGGKTRAGGGAAQQNN